MGVFGYIILFYIGFYFFRLAENYGRNKWLYGFLGIFFFVSGFVSYIIYKRIFEAEEFDSNDIAFISLKSIFSGLLFSFVLFHVINFIWKKNDKH
jgi:cellobiose-specific phosphotransferase system component IIC